MNRIYRQIQQLIDAGIYDQNDLFNLIYPKSGKHYHTIRTAIHDVKTSIIKV